MDIKKVYNHFSVESEFLKNDFFQKLYKKTKKTKRDTVITQMPIQISKDTSIESMSGLIRESVIANYKIMKWKNTKILPIFDTEQKNLNTKNYENILIKSGIFFDMDQDNIVYSEKNTNFVRNLFVELVEAEHIYEDCSINYRSIDEQKTLGNNEITRKTKKIKEYNIRYFVNTKNITLIVPTLQPETIFADVALAVNPNDKRYKKLIGHKVIIPIINKAIPIIADESVDTIKGQWVMRITPTHDKKSLTIAKKHELAIDNFAIHKDGTFTKCAGDFCWKQTKEFISNIIKNLNDIHNLESTTDKETKIAVHKKTGEIARPLLCNQLFIKIEEEGTYIKNAIQTHKIKIIPEHYQEKITNTIENIWSRPVTKEDSKWYALPLRTSKTGKKYFISDNNFLNLPLKKTENKYTVLSLIIFNLIVDGRLREHFSIEECIDVLLGTSRTGKGTTLETYIEIFSETLPRGYSKDINELKKIVEYGTQEVSKTQTKWISYFEKFSWTLTDMLETSIAIISKKKWFYSFIIDTLTNDEGLTQHKEKIEENIGNGLILIKIMEEYSGKKQDTKKIFCIKEHKTEEFLKTVMTWYNVQEKILFNETYIQTEKEKKGTLKELTKKRGSDCTRLYAINWETPIKTYENFITKFWNASRFIAQNIDNKKAKKIFHETTKDIEKKEKQLNEFETWIIFKTKELQKEYEDMLNKNMLDEIQNKMIHFITNDFCDKYLEIQKYQDSDNSEIVMRWTLGKILQMLHPFIPFVTQHIRNIIGLEWAILEQKIEENFSWLEKNYRTQLFVNIIDRLLHMKKESGYQKHERVDICFLAPLDFLQYLREQKEILQKLINTANIDYLDNKTQLETYRTENIINITIGMKAQKKEIIINKKQTLNEQLNKKEQELQSIRTLIPGLSEYGVDPKIITQKKKEMNKIKAEIEEINYKIQKEKLNK